MPRLFSTGSILRPFRNPVPLQDFIELMMVGLILIGLLYFIKCLRKK